MPVIHKKTFAITDIRQDDTVVMSLPPYAEVLSVGHKPGDPVGLISVWYRCTPDTGFEERRFFVVGTGNPCPNARQAKFLTTVFYGGLVFHIFEAIV